MKLLRELPEQMHGPGIREIADLAMQIPGTIDLSVGQPDFQTPMHIIEAACSAAKAGYTKYTPYPGLVSLRERLVEKLAHQNNISADINTVTVTPGGTWGMAVSIIAVTRPGEKILVPSPGYPIFDQLVELHGGIPLRYSLEEKYDFMPRIDDLERLIDDQTRAIVINSPSNPTGAVFSRQVVENLVHLAVEHDLYLISDEVYEAILFEGDHISPAVFDQDGRVISVFSFSKTYAMTGWRIGYVVASPALSTVVRKLLEPHVGAACSVSQKAAEAALVGDQKCVQSMCKAYYQRREIAMELLKNQHLRAFRPRGAFYLFVDISMCQMDSISFAKRLLQDAEVAVRPGEIFGPDGRDYIRISIAASEDDIKKGIRRLGEYINHLV